MFSGLYDENWAEMNFYSSFPRMWKHMKKPSIIYMELLVMVHCLIHISL